MHTTTLHILRAALCLAACAAAAPAAEPAPATLTTTAAPTPGVLAPSLDHEAQAAVERSLAWLAARQRDDGAWSNDRFPALTALALMPFLHRPAAAPTGTVDRAVTFLLGCVQPDGGIYRDMPGRKGGGLSNYNTAICMTALHATRRPDLAPVIRRARTFVAAGQHTGGDAYDGGFGYDASTGRAYTDLLNTYYAVVAMRETQDVEDTRPADEPRVDIDWDAAMRYIARMQNPPHAPASEAGGFVYNPSDPKAGTVTNAEGAVFFRSYGSITYAGMLAMIYANVSRDDPRVRSAFDWSARHWSLEENPGMGDQGLYFFYNVLAKSLDAYGRDLLPAGDTPVDWRRELISRLVRLQQIDPDTGAGYWKNENNRFWESDPVLVTAYSLLALQYAL